MSEISNEGIDGGPMWYRVVLAISTAMLFWLIFTITPHIRLHPLSLIVVVIPFFIIGSLLLLVGMLIPIPKTIGIVVTVFGLTVLLLSTLPFFMSLTELLGTIELAGLLIFGTPAGVMITLVGVHMFRRTNYPG